MTTTSIPTVVAGANNDKATEIDPATPGNKLMLLTHNGPFHADDLIAAAIIIVLHKQVDSFDMWSQLIRARHGLVFDALIGQPGVVTFDVGGKYDPDNRIFDHHFVGSPVRDSTGIPYASAGLVLRHYCDMAAGSYEEDVPLALRAFVECVDASDTGHAADLVGWRFSRLVAQVNPMQENGSTCLMSEFDVRFMKVLPIVVEIVERLFHESGFSASHAQDVFEEKCVVWLMHHQACHMASTQRVLQALTQPPAEGRIVFHNYEPAADKLLAEKADPSLLYAVFPAPTGDWVVKQIAVAPDKLFTGRKALPAAWAGLRGAELAAVTGVQDAVYCAPGRFVCSARTITGALRLARKAVAAA